jgi:hypothetical protein
MIRFEIKDDYLILSYETRYGTDWVYHQLEKTGSVTLKGTYEFVTNDLFQDLESDWKDDEFTVRFKVAALENEYFKFERRILGLDFDLYIHKDVRLTQKTFTSEGSVSIFRRVKELKPGDVYIGGSEANAMSEAELERMLNVFPNSYELRKYVIARVSSVVRESFITEVDGEEAYTQYLNRKLFARGDNLLSAYTEGDILKYSALLAKLQDMLDSEKGYSERQWQNEIVQILLLIYPKYISIFREVPLKDTYTGKVRRLDYLLIDSTGNTDLVEIKKPFDKCIVSNGKYRDNFIPLRDLSGTIMQVEKYVFLLNKWGKKGEDTLTERYRNQLPDGFEIKITNPSGIVIMGRDNNLSEEQRQDFEVIKRKYKNIIDILTYDDLLRRIRFTIEQLEKRR